MFRSWWPARIMIESSSIRGSSWQMFRSNLDLNCVLVFCEELLRVQILAFCCCTFRGACIDSGIFGLHRRSGGETVAGAVSCEVRQFGRYSIVVRTRGMSFVLLRLRLGHCDLRFVVCLPCVNFVAGAAGWDCFLCRYWQSKNFQVSSLCL